MTKEQLRTHLDNLGYTQIRFAHEIGVGKYTVMGWTSGRTKVPGPIVAYIQLAHKYRAMRGYLMGTAKPKEDGE